MATPPERGVSRHGALGDSGASHDDPDPPRERRRVRRSNRRYYRLLAATDPAAAVVAVSLSALVAGNLGREIDLGAIAAATAMFLPVSIVVAFWPGLYHEWVRQVDHNYVSEIGRVGGCHGLGLGLRGAAGDAGFGRYRATDSVPGLADVIPALLIGRTWARACSRRQGWSRRSVAVIGGEGEIDLFAGRIERHPEWGLDFGLLLPIATGAVTTDWRAVAARVEEAGIDRAIIVGGPIGFGSRTRLVQELVESDVGVDQMAGGAETLYANAFVQDLEGMPVLSVRSSSPRPMSRAIKRVFDVVVATIGLVLTAPVPLRAGVRIKIDSKGPVFYRQERCGLDDQPFELVKLRTMYEGAHEMRPSLREETRDSGNDDVLFNVEDDPRVTKVGKKLREWSIDEIPQLWNVLKGEMRMVGPRPLVFEEAEQATDLFAPRTRMRPRIASPWQSLGRSSIPFEEMMKLDYSYVVSWSMLRQVGEILALLHPENVLDAGSGAGETLKRLGDLIEGEVTGIDLKPESVDHGVGFVARPTRGTRERRADGHEYEEFTIVASRNSCGTRRQSQSSL